MTKEQRQGLLDMAETLRRQAGEQLAQASDRKDLKELIGCVKELAALYKNLEDLASERELRVTFAPELEEWSG